MPLHRMRRATLWYLRTVPIFVTGIAIVLILLLRTSDNPIRTTADCIIGILGVVLLIVHVHVYHPRP